jgi:hypothetical protein
MFAFVRQQRQQVAGKVKVSAEERQRLEKMLGNDSKH